MAAVELMREHPTSRSIAVYSSSDSDTRNPGMLSSLSSVPPVWPRPRPDIFGTTTPHAAARGASAIDTLSPTPPVLCLPTLIPAMASRLTRSPDRTIASVSHVVSTALMPFRTIAMSSAEIW